MKWIRVEDQLPESYDVVIVTVRSKNDPDFADVMTNIFYNGELDTWGFEVVEGEFEPIYEDMVVTHWMPYPEPAEA